MGPRSGDLAQVNHTSVTLPESMEEAEAELLSTWKLLIPKWDNLPAIQQFLQPWPGLHVTDIRRNYRFDGVCWIRRVKHPVSMAMPRCRPLIQCDRCKKWGSNNRYILQKYWDFLSIGRLIFDYSMYYPMYKSPHQYICIECDYELQVIGVVRSLKTREDLQPKRLAEQTLDTVWQIIGEFVCRRDFYEPSEYDDDSSAEGDDLLTEALADLSDTQRTESADEEQQLPDLPQVDDRLELQGIPSLPDSDHRLPIQGIPAAIHEGRQEHMRAPLRNFYVVHQVRQQEQHVDDPVQARETPRVHTADRIPTNILFDGYPSTEFVMTFYPVPSPSWPPSSNISSDSDDRARFPGHDSSDDEVL